MKFEIQRITGADLRGPSQNPRDPVAHHDVAAGEQTLVALRVSGQSAGEIIQRMPTSIDKTRHRGAQSRLELGGAGAKAVDVGGQHPGA